MSALTPESLLDYLRSSPGTEVDVMTLAYSFKVRPQKVRAMLGKMVKQGKLTSKPAPSGKILRYSLAESGSVWSASAPLLERVRLRLEAKKKTFKQARAEILAYLKKEGWAVKDHLKIPHATAPGEWGIGAPASVRLWFKAQAVYYSMGNSFKNARSLHIDDLRTMTPDMFMAHVKRWAK